MAIYIGRHVELGDNRKGIRPNAAGIEYAARNPYAFPGGWAGILITSDGDVLCSKCTRDNYRQIREATRAGDRSGWAAVAVTCTQFDEHDLNCANCNAELVACWLRDEATECPEGCAKSPSPSGYVY